MARLFIVDHSLKNEGGHHFDYTRLIAQASVAQGHETIVGTHRSFASPEQFPAACQTRSVFRQTTYSSFAHFQKILDITERSENESITFASAIRLQKALFGMVAGARQRAAWKQRIDNQRRQRESIRFSRELDAFFSEFRIQPSDRIFVPTTSEIDLAGVARFLQQGSQAAQANWHLQFHYNYFVGRTPEYEFQNEFVGQARDSLLQSMEVLRQFNVNLYTTTDSLSRQFAALGIPNVPALAYPVNTELRNRKRHALENRRLTVTCAGAMRPEKGEQAFSKLLSALWRPFLNDERIKLVIQRKQRGNQRGNQQGNRPNKVHSPRRANSVESLVPGADALESAVHWANHPLPRKAYVDLIRDTDIGLLMYDSRAYYSRRAGILGEYLTAGIPVIVPAGNWLSDQIAEPNFRYADQLILNARRSGNLRTDHLEWQNNAAANLGQIVVGDRAELQPHAIISTQPEASGKSSSGIVLEFQFLEPTTPGYYLKIELNQYDRYGNEIQQQTEVVGIRECSMPNRLFIRTANHTDNIRLRLSNAYEDSLLLLSNIKVHCLTDNDASARRRPLGAVGLIAADISSIARLLDDMVENHAHYASSAEQFSGDWFDAHNPTNTIRDLFRKDNYSRAAA